MKICNWCEGGIGEHEDHVMTYLHYEVDGWIEVPYHIKCVREVIR